MSYIPVLLFTCWGRSDKGAQWWRACALETGGPSPHLASAPGMGNVGRCWYLSEILTAILGHLEDFFLFLEVQTSFFPL